MKSTGSRIFQTAVVLVEPREAGNIGAAARAMSNMGLHRLILVRPVDHLVPDSWKMALSGRKIVEQAEVREDLPSALEGFTYVAGTTRREGAGRDGRVTPRELAAEVAEVSCRDTCALLFGREDRGLTNEELAFCHRLVTIPSTPEGASLNLAQAVLVLGYELFIAAEEHPLLTPRPARKRAETGKLEALFEHMEQSLLAIDYLHPDNSASKMRRLRRLFGRTGLDDKEVKALRGIFRQMEWYSTKGR